MFRKVLVANRGEVALRVIRTCRRLGVATVAVFSDADRNAPHVRAASEALRLGPAPPGDSYLAIDRVIAAAHESGAEALHPGYGFLSERPELAEACHENGITFIGPSPEAMRRLGDKIGARRLAHASDVPVCPGYDGDDQDPERLRVEAERLGAPLLIKAAAGGGGRGMRLVEHQESFPAALAAAQQEAQQAFGDNRVFLERLVTGARHVEVQILGDQHGTVVPLGDRDCSFQRRHQKVVEEAPAPHLPHFLRQDLHASAVRLAAAAGYSNAGTVEFLVEGNRFFLLELNARLQVEHTVTEEVTGLDLVELQLRAASGERLGSLRDVQMHGHAIQARIYAEDPAAGFVPQPGVVTALQWPAGPGVRVDASITQAGQEVTGDYDPLLGKVITWGADRQDAVRRMERALLDTIVLGVPSTTGFLRRAVTSQVFRSAEVVTDFLDGVGAQELLAAPAPPLEVLQQVAGSACTGNGAWRTLAGWRQGRAPAPITLHWGNQVLSALPHPLAVGIATPGRLPLVTVTGEDGAPGRECSWQGERYVLWLDVPVARPTDSAGPSGAGADSGRSTASDVAPLAPANWFITAPLPGKAGARLVEAGAEVAAGAALSAIEAMKMQHQLLVDRPGRVVRWLAEPGTFVRAGAPLVELAPLDGAVAGQS